MKRFYSIFGGWIFGVLMRRRMQADSDVMRRMEYGSSTQRLGVRFTERMRDVWRGRWIHRSKADE